MEEDTIKISKSTIWMVAFAVVLLAGGIFLVNWQGNKITGGVVGVASGVVEVTTTLQGFKYNPDTITVNRGDTVVLTIQNKDDVNHGLHLPQFGVVDSIPPGSTKTVQFVAVETPTNGQAVPTCSQEHGETLTFNVV